MLTTEKIKLISDESLKIRLDPKILSAIKHQEELSLILNKLYNERFELEDKLIDLYRIGCSKIPNEDLITEDDCKSDFERIIRVGILWSTSDDKIKKLSSYANAIPELQEVGQLEQLLSVKVIEWGIAFLKYYKRLFDDKNELFSNEYKNKIEEYANNGIFLYYLETPDLPITHQSITQEDILDYFLLDDCYPFKIMFRSVVTTQNPSPSMRRKIEDIIAMVENLSMEFYRPAALTAFALIESECKNCSDTLNGFFEAKKELKTAKEKSEEIEQLLQFIDNNDLIDQWKIIEEHYKKMITSKDNPIIDRNLLVHGKYYNDKMDITAHDVVKLILLFINIRYISSFVQNYLDLIKQINIYGVSYYYQELKKTTK